MQQRVLKTIYLGHDADNTDNLTSLELEGVRRYRSKEVDLDWHDLFFRR